MATIPESHRDLLTGVTFAHIATVMKSGAPQVTPVWIDVDGDIVVFNTAEGRQKTKNLDRDGRVALSIQDPQNPYRYLQIRGRVTGRTHEGADAHIDKLAKKYLNLDEYPYRNPAEQRVIYRIQADSVQAYG
jgi:PPOX class probable F420-dependent enzyme